MSLVHNTVRCFLLMVVLCLALVPFPKGTLAYTVDPSHSSHLKSDISLLESQANAVSSLQVPANVNTTCTPLNAGGYTSRSCPNVNWNTYGFIQNISIATQVVDMQLDCKLSTAMGTRVCSAWYRDLLCRMTYPRCPSSSDNRQGGPCWSECVAFSSQCPGMAMACNGFSNQTCWNTTTSFLYGSYNYKNSAISSSSSPLLLLFILIASLFAILWS
jgi:hypothetical protein